MTAQQNSNEFAGSASDTGVIACTQCGAPMPREMRFCRSCGHRLGEGPAEYTETVRFADPRTGAQTQGPFMPGYSAPVARHTGSEFPYKRKRRLSGMTWILIIIGIFFVVGGGLSALRRTGRNLPRATDVATPSRSYFGVPGFRNTDGGVTFGSVDPPGSPADKAGLVGGDIITTFDGHAVTDDDRMIELLQQTPIGKTVEIIYLRDGEAKTTQLTTISKMASDELGRVFRSRPEGRGMFGFETDRTTQVSDPANKIYGVRLDYVEPNGPADLFGIKEGDIITEFGGVPIRTDDELLSRVRRAIPRSTVDVTVIRDGKTIKIPVTIGRTNR